MVKSSHFNKLWIAIEAISQKMAEAQQPMPQTQKVSDIVRSFRPTKVSRRIILAAKGVGLTELLFTLGISTFEAR